MKPQLANDWGQMMDELLRSGVDTAQIGREMGGNITERMIRLYRTGVQPTHWRGEALLLLWCKITGKAREKAPRCEIVHGRRADRRQRAPTGGDYSAGYLAAWAQIGVAQVKPKGKGGRPRKVKL